MSSLFIVIFMTILWAIFTKLLVQILQSMVIGKQTALKYIQGDLFFFSQTAHIFVCIKILSDLALKNRILCSQQGQTSCWKHIFEFEPNMTTFYYTQKYEPSTKKRKGLLEWILGQCQMSIYSFRRIGPQYIVKQDVQNGASILQI